CVGNDLGSIGNPGQGVVTKGESEAEPRHGVASSAREPITHESAAGDVLSPEVFHRPPQRTSNSLERRGDLPASIFVHRPVGKPSRPIRTPTVQRDEAASERLTTGQA